MLDLPLAASATSEAVILARWDAGDSIEKIVAETPWSRRRVEHVIEIFHVGPSERERAARRALPAACDELARRMLALAARSRSGEVERRNPDETRELNAELAKRIEALCERLLPNGHREGGEWVAANVFDDATGTSSLSVCLRGAKRGSWRDFATHDVKGLPLNLIRLAACGGDWAAAYDWAYDFLGRENPRKSRASDDPEVRARIAAERAERALQLEQDRLRREAEAAAERERIRRSAVARWQEARALAPGDPVVAYLAARGIDLAALHALTGQAPGALRFNPDLQYGRAEKGAPPPWRGPAMVAMVTALSGEHIATHRTWLDPARPAKAGPELLGGGDAKKVLGNYAGGHIPLWKGAHRHPLKDIPAGTDVYASEGIEDGLTAACADPALRVIAAISVGNLAQLALPPQMGRLIILKQNDPEGSDADRAVREAAAAHRAAGRRVGFVRAPQGAKDLNELAQRGMK